MDVLILMQGMIPVPGRPVTGNGLRAHALSQGLVQRGHRVRLATRSIDADDVDPARLPADLLRYDDGASIAELVTGSGADAVVVCQWELLEQLPEPCPIPVIADLNGPRLVEMQFERADLDREGARFVEQLRRADAFLVASDRQRWFALPWLMLAGFDCRNPPLHVVPISADPHPPLRFRRKPVADPTFVTGGVFWPWRRSEGPLARLLAVLDRTGRGNVQLFGGAYPLATAASVAYRDPRDTLPPHPRLRFRGMVPYDQLFALYAGAQVAFDVMEPNAERELSFSFRVIDYLAASLPVVTNRFTEIAAAIDSCEAGWVIDVEAPGELERTVEQILAEPAEVARRGANARRLVETRFAWDHTVEPLDRYLRAPARATRGASVLGTLVQVAGEAFRAREERLREIERSRQAVHRAEALDQELAALRRADAERANEANLARAELEARTRDLESIKEQTAAWRRDAAAQSAELEALRDTIGRKQRQVDETIEQREALRREADALTHRIEALEQSLRHHDKVGRELDAERDRLSREADALRSERDRERARVTELVAESAEKREQARRDAEALAHRVATLEQEIRQQEKRTREQESEHERDARALRERMDGELRDVRAQAEHRAEQLRGELSHRDAEAQRLKAALAQAEHERERGVEECKQLTLQAERAEAKCVESERRFEHAREQLAARELELARAKGAAVEAERERDRLAQDLQNLTRARDALESKAHQLEQRLESRNAEVEELARQVATLRGELESRTAEIARKHAELDAVSRERDHERSRGAVRDEEIHKLKDAVSDRERERDRAAADAQDLRSRLDGMARELHESGVTTRAQAERAAHELESLRAALGHEREVRGAAESALAALRAEAHEARARQQGELERLAHEAASRDRDLAWYRAEADSKERALGDAHRQLADLQATAHELGNRLAASDEQLARAAGNAERLSAEVARLEHATAKLDETVSHHQTVEREQRTEIDRLTHAVTAGVRREGTLEAELERLRATPLLGFWLRLLGRHPIQSKPLDELGPADPASPPTPTPPERSR